MAVSFTVGAALSGTVAAATGSTVKHLDRMRNAAQDAEDALGEVAGYRKAKQALDAANASLDTAERRHGAASATSRRLTAEVRRQESALRERERALEASGVDVRNLDAEERRLTETLRRQKAQYERLDDAMQARDAAAERRRSLRGDLVEAGAVAYALVRPMQAVVGAAVEFEEKMADVGKVVDFPAPGGLQAMGEDLLALSKTMPVTASGFAEIVASAGQLGIAHDELTRFAEGAAKMGVAFDLSAMEAGQAMAGLRNIYQLGQDGVMDMAGAYNHLSNNMAATAPGLLDIANRVGSTGREVGLTGQQLGALGATLLAMQTPPEVAATALKSMFITLGAATGASKEARAALDGIGLSAAGVEEAMRIDAETAIVDLLAAVSKSDNALGTLSKLFGREHAGEIVKLVGAQEEYAKARRLASAAEADATSLQREYEVRAATTANALTILGNRVKGLSINIGAALLPGLNAVLGPIGAVADVGAALAAQFPRATTAVVALTAGLVVAKIGLVAYRYAGAVAGESMRALRARLIVLRPAVLSTTAALRAKVGALAGVPAVGAAASGGIGRVTRSLRVLRLALVSTGIGAVVVGIGMAVAWLVAHWEGVKAFFGGFARGASGALDALGPLGSALRMVGEAIGSVFGWIGSLFEPAEQSAESLASWASAGERLGQTLKSLIEPIATVAGWAQAVVNPFGYVKDLVGKAQTPKLGDAAKTVAAGAVAGTAAVAAAQPAPPLDVVPSPTFSAPIHAPPPATTSSVRVTANVTVNPPAGADEQAIAREVARQIRQAQRRAEIEAGLGESDA